MKKIFLIVIISIVSFDSNAQKSFLGEFKISVTKSDGLGEYKTSNTFRFGNHEGCYLVDFFVGFRDGVEPEEFLADCSKLNEGILTLESPEGTNLNVKGMSWDENNVALTIEVDDGKTKTVYTRED